MAAAAREEPKTDADHIPVLLDAVLEAVAPVEGIWLDGTFGAGGYSRALLQAGARKVYAIDRDPTVLARAAARDDGPSLMLFEGRFGELDRIITDAGVNGVDGVVLDIGVSSMQIDEAERGFSFQKDGPLDMRMGDAGPTATEIVNRASEAALADIFYRFGEERAARRIAAALVRARKTAPIETTGALAEIVSRTLPRPRPGQPHAATRSFQALRIVVNDELGELAKGLMAAEAVLKPGGRLAVVTFHSLEDRIVKRFVQLRSGEGPRGSRHAPEVVPEAPRFERLSRKAILPGEEEIARNPRARSAKLRVARRLAAPAGRIDPSQLGVPEIPKVEGLLP
ncbi:MAG: 16S rRNA (cytosine(1402)-N(4))-methyltransferase RsmH [Pseudomonadota bacterium]